MTPPPPPPSPPPDFDYSTRRPPQAPRTPLEILGGLMGGMVVGVLMMMVIPHVLRGASANVGIAMWAGVPVVSGLVLMRWHSLRMFGIGIAMVPVIAYLAIYTLCGR